MSLRLKILLPLACFTSIFFLYLYGYWMPRSLANIEAGSRRSLEQHLESVAEGLVPLLLGHQLDAVYENLDSLMKKNRDWTSMRLRAADGRTLYPLETSPRAAADNIRGKDIHVVELKINYLETALASLMVSVDFGPRLSDIRKRHGELMSVMLIIILIFTATAGFVIDRLVRRPVNLLARASQRLAEGDFDVPLVKAGDDEVGILVDSFGDMRKAIREYRTTLQNAHDELQAELLERRRAEALLRKSNEIVERIFSMTTTCIAYMDRDFNFIRVNQKYADADGRTPEYFIGRNHFDLYPSHENEEIFRRVVETGEQYIARAKPFVYKEHPERGVSHWDWSLTPVKDLNGTVEALIMSLVDVTERLRVQEAVSRLNEELEQRVRGRTIELQEKNRELERMNKLFVGREMRMIALKERIKELEMKYGGTGDQDG